MAGAEAVMTRQDHINGTERISEGYLRLKKKFDLVVDIQGDEPLIDPINIDKVIRFHKRNLSADIVLPTLISSVRSSKNIVKVIVNKKNYVMYLSRYNLPYNFSHYISPPNYL